MGRLHRHGRGLWGSHHHRKRRRGISSRGRGGRLTESRPTSTTWPPLPVSHGGPWPRHSSSDRKRSLTPATRDLTCRNAVVGIGSSRRLGRRFAPPNTRVGLASTAPDSTLAGEPWRRHGPSKPPPGRNTLRQQRSATTQLPGTHVRAVPQRTTAEAPRFLMAMGCNMTGSQTFEAPTH